MAAALDKPFVEDPGGRMLYSTGNSHLLSAILTKETGRSTLALLNDWLGPAGVRVSSWERDPQGIYLGGNQMAMSPRSLLAFGELYRRGGRTEDGQEIIPESWIEQSWQPRTRSAFGNGEYGYGWFVRDLAGHRAYFGWGYGGQMIYVLPDLALTVAITSDPDRPSGRTGFDEALHALVAERIVPVAEERR
ncbi:Beta-lactamase class C and other penicillin binding protein [Lutibaculum baratangense AMV1]|uniref:Beta-lactamase class C and other penicillin binding protein n=1 Tax=Lutibaculum baratangense AMV1 TaxID=631454 RepID=V4R8D2_9HYPH|nr:Beta-lactamase class C and other penicillin binding protein [Lutibaculum baratangense AMV1]